LVQLQAQPQTSLARPWVQQSSPSEQASVQPLEPLWEPPSLQPLVLPSVLPQPLQVQP
jgi:hypothetical protein